MCKELNRLEKEIKDMHSKGPNNQDFVYGYQEAKLDALELLKQVEELNPSDSTGLDLPEIPKYVADRVSEYKKDGTYDIRTMLNRSDRRINNLQADDADFWIDNNQAKFAMAYSKGHTIEEKKYEVIVVDDWGGMFYLHRFNNKIMSAVSECSFVANSDDFALTKEEIKGYEDGIYWTLAKPFRGV